MRGRIALSAGTALVVGLALFSRSNLGSAPLLTGATPNACWAGGAPGYGGLLTVDSTYGTSVRGHPVMWPAHYSARIAGSEVEVVNATGAVVATTGRVYYFSQATYSESAATNQPARFPGVPVDAYLATADCGYFWSLIDCTSVAETTGDAAPDSNLGLRRSYCATIEAE
jgi:hypothetical protein